MKSKYLASAALCIAAATGFMACGDDVITVYGDEVYSIVDEIDDSTCTKANDGKMSLEKKSGTLFLCDDGKWTPVNGSEVVDLRCKSSLLKDSTGYNIICDGDTIATIYNGQNGKGSNGQSAYELAKANGLVDTTKIKSEKEWLESLQGENGKDILEQLKENKLLPDSIQTIEDLLKYLKGENGSAGSNGLSAYELAKANGLVDTTKIKSEKEWLKSLQGENGKDLLEQLLEKKLIPDTVTTVAKLLEYLQGKDADEKAITEKLEESLSCKVLTEEDIDPEDEGEPLYLHPDEELGIMIVPVKCGKNVSTLELPIYVTDYALLENLAKHYKKHVVVRIPFIDINDGVVENDISGYDYFENVWKNLQSNGAAELTVMEVDSSNFNQTGKNFISDLVASDAKPYVTYDEIDGTEFSYKVVRLEGDVDVTNLINSYAQLRVSLNLKVDDRTFPITFNAIVNLNDESEIVVVDFLSDYKAARVKELMKGEKAEFAKVSAQANKELAEALGLKAEKDFPAFETYLSDEVEVNENQNMFLWPAMLSMGDMGGYVSYSNVYAKYKEAFAKNGALDQDLPGSFNGQEYKSMFMTDYIALFGMSSDGSSSSTYNKTLKVVQNSFIDIYGLEECSPKTVGVVQSEIGKTKGAFEYFVCDESREIKDLWVPITEDNVDDYLDELVTLITGKKCETEKDLQTFVSFELFETQYDLVCRNDSWPQKWVDAGDKCAREGEYFVVGSTGALSLFVCKKNKTGELVKETIDYGDDIRDYYNNLCESDENVGKIFPTQYYYVTCAEPNSSSSSNLRDIEFYQGINPEDVNLVAKNQIGECTAANDKSIETIHMAPSNSYSYMQVVCLDKQWLLKNAVGETSPMLEYGACTEELMKKGEVYRVNVLEQQKGTLTGYKYYKCDCDYIPGSSNSNQESSESNAGTYENCKWQYASSKEIELNEACNAAQFLDEKWSEDGKYVCKQPESSDSHDWGDPNISQYCNKNAKTPTKKFSDEPKMDGNYTLVQTIYAYCHYPNPSDNTVITTYVKEAKDEEWESPNAYFGSCQQGSYLPASASSGAAILMDGYKEAEIYTCNVNSPSYWYKKSLDEFITFASTAGQHFPSKNVEIQSRFTYTMPTSNNGYTYRGVVTDVEGNKTIYVSNNKKVWFGVNEYCNEKYAEFILSYDESSCEHPCEFLGETYYYDFNNVKWRTLAEMNLTTCPDMETYCDANSPLVTEYGVTCAQATCEPEYYHYECSDGRIAGEDGCDCSEDGCDPVNDDPPAYCGNADRGCNYPFMRYEYAPYCGNESGVWETTGA